MLLLLSLACVPQNTEDSWEPVELLPLVDPFVGTGGLAFGYGGLSPAATAPNGLAKVGPDTLLSGAHPGFNHSAGYYHGDGTIQAFSHTRLPGIGVGDGGGVGFMPTTTETVDPEQYRYSFLDADGEESAELLHADEQASPGYYRVKLPGVATVELAASPRAAHHRYRMNGQANWLTIDLGNVGSSDVTVPESWLLIDAEANELRGYAHLHGSLTSRGGRGLPVYFVARFSQPWAEGGLWLDGERAEGGVTLVDGERAAASLRFEASVEVKVGLSVVDIAGAMGNLEEELGERTLEETVAATELAWEEALSPFQVAGGSADELAMFSTALYHCLQMPTLYSDVDGRYRALDGEVAQADGWLYYSDFSLWDTYRTLHPLVTLAWPTRARDYARSLADMAERIGYLPRWPAGVVESSVMVGTPADIVLADSWLKGVQDFDGPSTFALAFARATDRDGAHPREGLSSYQDLGYLPVDQHGGATAKTLEYAVADGALAMWAGALGLEADQELLAAQALSYDNVFNPETGFMQGRNTDGSWAELQENDTDQPSYTEGNAWQYTWLVPHHAEGLAESFGGIEPMVAKLTEFFELSAVSEPVLGIGPYYWHGNEPDIAAALLFAEVGHPADTQRWMKWVRDEHYGLGADGLAGNDDGGTLSAWYVWSALGLFPSVGTSHYVLTTPLFTHARVVRPEGDLNILGAGEGDYVADLWLNDAPLHEAVVQHSQLAGETTLSALRWPSATGWGSW